MKHDAKFILSKSKLMDQYNLIKSEADKISYSFKSNYDVGKVLEENSDCDFSIHAISKLDLIEDKKRVWFFAQAWDEEELETLFSKNVRKFVVDNEEDLNKLTSFVKDKDVKIDLLLRMKLKENTIHTGKHFVFGMYSTQINNLIPELRENNKINKLGIHFHRKTQNISEWSLKYELEQSINVWDQIDIVNIGGGFPSKYKNYRKEVINYIFEKVRELKKFLNEKDIEMIIEPGRLIAAPCVELHTEIKSIYNRNIVINCSLYNSSMDTFIAHTRLLVKNELQENQGTPFTIKGCTPCSMDIFRYRVFLDNPKVGDKIIFLNAGAYNFSTDFSGLEKIPVEVIE